METKTTNTVDWNDQIGIIPNDGKNSVEQVREIRKQLEKEEHNFGELNNFGDELKEETDIWDKLSDEALENFEKSN
tara:strand:- start:157 stop:384 length:228 start_codon:yes stop_codon:yes gene_type:complete